MNTYTQEERAALEERIAARQRTRQAMRRKRLKKSASVNPDNPHKPRQRAADNQARV